jgi:hypothetical protein
MLTECPVSNIKMRQKQEDSCALPDCKGKPIFGPFLLPNDFTINEGYLCVACKELIVSELIERVIAKKLPFKMLNN